MAIAMVYNVHNEVQSSQMITKEHQDGMVMLICGNGMDYQDGDGCTTQYMQHNKEQNDELTNLEFQR